MPEFLTLEQVSQILQAPPNTVRWWIQTRRLPAFKPGRALLVKKADFEAFVAASAVERKGAERAKRARAGKGRAA